MVTTEEELAALRTKIQTLERELIRGGTALDDDDTGKGIPSARFREHRADYRKVREALDDIKTDVASTIASLGKAHAKAIKEATDAAKTAETSRDAQHAEDLGLAEMGISDATGRRLIREHVAGLPEAERTDGSAGWLKARRAAVEEHAKDGTKPAPPVLNWLSGYEQPKGNGRADPPAPRGPNPPPNTSRGANDRGGDGVGLAGIQGADTGTLDAAFGWEAPST